MINEGYIKLYRKTLDNPIICKDSDYFSVWIYLLLTATHDENDVFFKNNRITLKAGQLITGRKIISEKFNIDESKVQRILKYFEKQHQIKQQTSTKNRLISIVNWDEYQIKRLQNEQQVNNNRTTSEQQVNTNKNDKNDKNIYNNNNNIYSEPKTKSKNFVKPTLDEIKNYCLERKNKIDYEKFYNYYESIGWKVGKNPMKDWKATVRTWERNNKTYNNAEEEFLNG